MEAMQASTAEQDPELT